MLYPPEVIEEVRMLNDIIDVVSTYVALKPQGGNHFGLCPFHREKSPSFSVNAERQMFHCFGCGAGGNVISFIMQIENYDFLESLKFLADRAHYPLPQTDDSQAARGRARQKELLAEINQKAARFFYDFLQTETAEAVKARDYLDQRNVLPPTRTRYGLGLSPPGWDGLFKHLTGLGYPAEAIKTAGLAIPNKTGGHYDRFRGRLMFPILDLNGKVVGFGGRALESTENAKYINSPDTPLFDKSRLLYGLNLARKARRREIILVEGYMDTVSLHQAGFPYVAGVLGTAMNTEHARLLKRINCESVILLLDSDEAGTAAALRAIPILLDGGVRVRVLQVTGAKDPDEFITVYGPERFAGLLGQAQSHIAFRVGLLRKQYALDNTEQRITFTREAAALLATLTSAIETDAYVSEVAGQTGISPDAIRAEIDRARAGQAAAPGVNVPILRRFGKRAEDKGLHSARKALIRLLFTRPDACRRLYASQALPPHEMGGGLFTRLLTIAYSTVPLGKTPLPADIVNRFETLEEQKQVAEIFLSGTAELYEDISAVEKSLNEMTMVIKRAWFDRQMEEAAHSENALNAVNTLFEAKRNMQTLYITMSDG